MDINNVLPFNIREKNDVEKAKISYNWTQKNVDPRTTNRGVENTYESDLRSLVDWVGVTLKDVQSEHDVIDILGIKRELFQKGKKGGFGYRDSIRFGAIAIYFNGAENMGIHVEMSGQGCRQFEESSSLTWSTFFALLLNFDVKFTRLDIAIDDFKGYFKISTLKRTLKEKRVRSKFKEARSMEKYQIKDAANKGQTMYFGSDQSEIQFRFYDKLLEQEGKNKEVDKDIDFWNRTEVQTRDDRATALALVIAYQDYSVGEAITGLLKNYITFCKKSDDSNRSRWKPTKWWSDFLGNAEKLSLSQVAPDRSIEKSQDWIERQTTATLALLFEAYEADMNTLHHFILEGLTKQNNKHLDMLNRYRIHNGKEPYTQEQYFSIIEQHSNNLLQNTQKKSLEQSTQDQ